MGCQGGKSAKAVLSECSEAIRNLEANQRTMGNHIPGQSVGLIVLPERAISNQRSELPLLVRPLILDCRNNLP